MKTSNRLFVLGLLSALPGAVTAADSGAAKPPVDTSKWECKSCKFEDGTSGTVDVGVGHVSQGSFKFGEYTGLEKKGGFFIGDGAARFRGADAAYWNANASNLGLDSRSLDAEGGRQGKYKLLLKYDGLPHLISDSARTPFLGAGGSSLTLPAGFPAATTGLMPLASTLQEVDLGTQRKRLGVGVGWTSAQDWEYGVNFRRETKEGTKRSAGAFLLSSAHLVEPVDYVTDQVDASASYRGDRWQAKFAYYGSKFRNSNDALTWQNPFTPVLGGVAGQLALPPDNQFHQILASAGYQFSARTRASFDIAWGRMSQNESFLAATLNPGAAAGALPASSLNGSAATLDAGLKLTSAVTERLRLNAAYTHNDRDNRTPQGVYPVVLTDVLAGIPRTNLPYSFTQDKVKLSGDYRISALAKASAGFDSEERKRTFQESDKTREDTLWGRVILRVLDRLDLTAKVAYAERKASAYRPVVEVVPVENPLLRKYNMADRRRESVGVRADIAATETINIGLGVDWANDDYSSSSIGLISARDYGVNGDLSVMLTPQTSLHFFANYQEIESRQAGSAAVSTPDWFGENRDKFDFIGIGLKHEAIKNKLDIGADYGISHSRSQINVITGAADPAFPHITTSLDSLRFYAIYRLKDNVSLQGSFWHERFDSKNWMLDGVAPNTITNVLVFGEQAPRYSVNVVRLALRYKF
ncbi:MAG: MtrB/PioB family decaheme-associated outer membrane protein [Betaproteobacteria bacterium]|nr:MtrB/PioB family decaheme-associated outer membrane protein [Betaproteobacteria bacterium]